MVDDYIERRHGRRKVTYIVPQMKDILENTYGILVYQEQIMQLAQKLAGYSLGEADLMRRAMGKKKKDEMVKHEAKFIGGAVERGIAKEKAEKIFSLMAQFADYGFNRSHSFAYAYLAYHTAYLKANYPTHFYAAVLTSEGDNTEKVARYIGEMKQRGFALLPPDINSSNQGFTPVGGAVRFGLAAIKGVGEAAVQAILRARTAGGNFKSLFDLAERVDTRAVNKRVFEAMIKSGAMDGVVGGDADKRAALLAVLDRALEQGAKTQRDRASGQIGFFELMPMDETEPELPHTKPWSKKEQLGFEKETLGFYASGHPLEDYVASLQGLANVDGATIGEHPHGDPVAMGGIVIDLAVRTTKKGDRFALFRLEDQFSAVKIVCWPEQFTKYKTHIEDNKALLVKGRLEVADDGAPTIITQEIQPLEGARAYAAQGMTIRLAEKTLTSERVQSLSRLFNQHAGHAPVVLELQTTRAQQIKIRPNQFLRVKITPDLEAQIKAICPDWEVSYQLN
jgi:DNA polymerase-3 subunit alpha